MCSHKSSIERHSLGPWQWMYSHKSSIKRHSLAFGKGCAGYGRVSTSVQTCYQYESGWVEWHPTVTSSLICDGLLCGCHGFWHFTENCWELQRHAPCIGSKFHAEHNYGSIFRNVVSHDARNMEKMQRDLEKRVANFPRFDKKNFWRGVLHCHSEAEDGKIPIWHLQIPRYQWRTNLRCFQCMGIFHMWHAQDFVSVS